MYSLSGATTCYIAECCVPPLLLFAMLVMSASRKLLLVDLYLDLFYYFLIGHDCVMFGSLLNILHKDGGNFQQKKKLSHGPWPLSLDNRVLYNASHETLSQDQFYSRLSTEILSDVICPLLLRSSLQA